MHTRLLCKDGKRKLQGGRGSRAAGGEGSNHARGGRGEPQAHALCRTSPNPERQQEWDKDNGLSSPGSALGSLLPRHGSLSLSKLILRSPFCYPYQVPLCSYQENKTRESYLGSIGASALRPSQNREKNVRLRPKEAES